MPDSYSLLENLNPIQRKACESIHGPQLLLAGAGSGKTRVLTYKIAYLIQQKQVDSTRILAVTFTNKAAREMKERITTILQSSTPLPWVGTFHSVCLKFLKRYAHLLGYTNQFSIYDSDEQKKVLKQILKEQNEPPGQNTPTSLKEVISHYKNKNLSPQDARSNSDQDEEELREIFFYEQYQEMLKKQNAMDFDDLILNTANLLKQETQVQTTFQNHFQYLFIDEFQDTNNSQFNVIRMLLNQEQNITVVGDEDQSIYKWRGADIQNILSFQKYFPKTITIKLEQNYRSSSNILNLANSVIKNNTERLGKKNWTSNEKGDIPILKITQDEREEAHWVALEIKNSLINFDSTAILYRTNAQSRSIEEELLRQRIPYTIVKGTRFYERKEIKDILAYLQIIINPQDNNNVKRIINLPKRSIGLKTIENISNASKKNAISFYECLQKIDQLVPGKNQKIHAFTHLIESFKPKLNDMALSQFVELVIQQTGYEEMLQLSKETDSVTRLENLNELIAAADDFSNTTEEDNLTNFLQEISLFTSYDEVSQEKKISLMTIHSAKGLEFKRVFLTGLEEELFPLNSDDLEEERRLFYVATTRAEEKLYLSSARSRRAWGNTQFKRPSRFLKEINSEFLEQINDELKNSTTTSKFSSQNSDSSFNDTFSNEPNYENFLEEDFQMKKSQKVYHPHFGNGIVLKVEGKGEATKVTVDFQGVLKKLAIKYANLSIVY